VLPFFGEAETSPNDLILHCHGVAVDSFLGSNAFKSCQYSLTLRSRSTPLRLKLCECVARPSSEGKRKLLFAKGCAPELWWQEAAVSSVSLAAVTDSSRIDTV
jgi:hypothetical protein